MYYHTSTRVYVGLGSNLGDRLGYLRRAADGFRRHPHIRVTGTSPVYENPAVTRTPGKPQPDFLNAVIELETTLTPKELLRACQELEQEAGRMRHGTGTWEARTLDIDLLVFGNDEIDEPGLHVPHPRMGSRRFVLQPLADLAPKLWIPPPFAAPVNEMLTRAPAHELPSRIEAAL